MSNLQKTFDRMIKFKLIMKLILFVFHSVDKDIITFMIGSDYLNGFIPSELLEPLFIVTLN